MVAHAPHFTKSKGQAQGQVRGRGASLRNVAARERGFAGPGGRDLQARPRFGRLLLLLTLSDRLALGQSATVVRRGRVNRRISETRPHPIRV